MSARRVLIFAMALASAVMSGADTLADRTAVQVTERPLPVRGLWVLRTSMTSPDSIARVVRTAVTGGYNTLLVQVRSRGDAYYRSAIDPRASELGTQPAGFDPLATVLSAGHAAGLKVHAWVNVNLVSSAATLPQSRSHVVFRHPEWLMVPKPLVPELRDVGVKTPAYLQRLTRWTRGQSDSVEGLFLSPATDAAQDYTVSVIRDLTRAYAIDGVHLDYSRYPTADFDFSSTTLDAFRTSRLQAVAPEERTRLDSESKADPLIWTRTYPQAWTAFRISRLTTLVQRIRTAVKTVRPSAVLSSAVIPDPAEGRDEHFQDWSTWAASGLLDVICPMAYATVPAAFQDQVTTAIAASHSQPIWIGVGAWRLPVEQTAAHLAIVQRSGAPGVLLFSYDSLATLGSPRGSYFTRLRPLLLKPAGVGPQRLLRPQRH